MPRIAILGAGPIGLEAALYAKGLGLEPVVYERGAVGENVRRWGFVRLFSPWRLNVSPLGLQALARRGAALPDPGACPTGRELVERYLEPIAASLGTAVRAGTAVKAISRCGLLKGDGVGGRRRSRAPFRLLVSARGRDEEALAEVVLDATGVYATPCSLGDGGIPALGESAVEPAIERHLTDVRGADRARFEGKTILVVGTGYSAATMLEELLLLRREAPATRVVWVRRSTGPDPFPFFENDPLPERSRLAREGNRIAAEPPEGVTLISGVTVRALSRDSDRVRVELRAVDGGGMPQTLTVDRLLACVGYRPDSTIHQELQVHQCYASEGPMTLAAALLGGSSGDCLAQGGVDADTLVNPEPGFFILGHKSYGRRSDFLLRVGREQVRDVFTLLRDDPSLDLYARVGLPEGW
ncbi:MAG: FAD-dependent oxidoreductase [Planctomycetes bacterium]|nr:FAD-dependent oxidoreductase [Planctomycetota bacterium]